MSAPAERPAWWVRAAALGVDVGPGAAVTTAAAVAAAAVPTGSAGWWLCGGVGVAALAATAANRVLLPAVTGWSLGRAIFGIAVVGRDEAAEPVGAARLLVRELAHLLDTCSVLVGWLWPLWDPRRRTFADLLTGTEVHRADPRRPAGDPPALAAAAGLAAALLCVAVAAVSYLVTYRPDRAADAARAQIAVRGPEIVATMLSYQPESLADDFARARDLATAHYREQLEPQQQAVRDKPVPNVYQVVNSAVLSAAADRAAMLLFLQGQRGDPGRERFISATVRVEFVRAERQWRVDDLTVLAKPASAEAEK